MWAEAVEAVANPRLRTITIGEPGADDLYYEWHRVREVDDRGAVLVRPDGVVAWRALTAPTDAADARRQLEDVLARLLGMPVLAETPAESPA